MIHDQMDQTKASLAEKIEALECQVRDTVSSATETVSSAVEGAKEVVTSVSEGAKQVVEKVSETVDTVKEKLSLRRYVEHYPWTSLGAAVAVGFVAAQLAPSRRTIAAALRGRTRPAEAFYPAGAAAAPAAERRPERSAWLGELEGVAKRAATTLEGLAVGTLMSFIKDMITSNLPREWHGELTQLVDEATTKLGGKVMHGNPLRELFPSGSRQQEHESCRTSVSQGSAI
jgi:ElaB/YqjD/DUF883 family membrane-anchored ribosome-binding protein